MERHGFVISSYLSIRHGKVEQELCEDIMVAMVIELLNQFSGDVVLEFDESPDVELRRENGVTTINSDWGGMSGFDLLSKVY